MKLIIAGCRDYVPSLEQIDDEVRKAGWRTKVTYVFSGGASGVDYQGEIWARQNKLLLKRYDARWDLWGRSAGPIRNRQMVADADALLAFWDGRSRGTMNMIAEASKVQLLVRTVMIEKVDDRPKILRDFLATYPGPEGW